MTDRSIKQILQRDSIPTVPWKNGGGVTREVAASAPEDGFWRLSIADVAQEGVFSQFVGLNRILTVIGGDGMVLKSPARTIDATLGHPVSFSGEEEIVGFLPNGPIQDFNLIYDPKVWAGQVNVGAVEAIEALHWRDAKVSALYCLSGTARELSIGEIQSSCGAVLRPGNFSLRTESSCRLLCVDLRPRH